MKRLLFFFLFFPVILTGQVTTIPAEFSDSDVIEVIFNAAEGSKGLQGYTGDMYAHTGVITSESKNNQDWKYAPIWGDNDTKYKLVSQGNDLWKLTITPDVRNYYKVPQGEEIFKLAFVFRSSDGSKEGKGAGGTDIFVNLNEAEFTPSEPITRKRPDNTIDGINYINDQTVTLVLYAPGKSHIHLLGDFNNWEKDNEFQLFKDGDYWWYTLTGLEKGKEYGFQYLVDNSFKIGDAYCEKILDPRFDNEIPATTYPNIKPYPIQTEDIVSVFQTGEKAYKWNIKNFIAPAKEDLIIYELLIRDFTEESSIAAAMDKLDYLQGLGINAIELMPIQEFDGNDSWGYNPCFFFAADKVYGTREAYKAFIDEAHQRGIAVILDVVFNHATAQHPFARLYWEGDAPAADNPWFNRTAPHPYSVFNDFNHEYTGTRDYFKRVLTYWLEEYKLDGFRFDLTKGFTQKQSTETTAGNYDASRIAILKDYNDHIRKMKPNAYVILEHFCENREEKELAEAGMLLWNNLNNAYAESAMGWKGNNTDLTGGSYSSRGWNIPALITYNESHDEERLMYKMEEYGNWNITSDKDIRLQRAALGAAFLLCTPGPKMIWQFGELGYDISIDYNGRTGRKPVLWNYQDEEKRMVLYDTYRKLNELRKDFPLLFSSPTNIEMQTAATNWEKGRAIRLKQSENELVLLGNYLSTSTVVNAGFTSGGSWKEVFSNETLSIGDDNRDQTITLPPHSFRLYILEKSSTGNTSVPKPISIRYVSSSHEIIIDSMKPVNRVILYGINGIAVAHWENTHICSLPHLPAGIYVVETDGQQNKILIK